MSPDLHQSVLQLPDGVLQAVQPAVGSAADVLACGPYSGRLGLHLQGPLHTHLLLREALGARL